MKKPFRGNMPSPAARRAGPPGRRLRGIGDAGGAGEDRPMARGAYTGSIFGPFNQPKTGPENQKLLDEAELAHVVRYNDGPTDVRGAADWKSIATRDLDRFIWGRVVIGVQSVAGATIVTMDAIPHVEIRIITYLGGLAEIVFEGAAGQRQEAGSNNSPGPVSFEWDEGTMPDRFEVQARSRRGGDAETTGAADEILSVSVQSRFFR